MSRKYHQKMKKLLAEDYTSVTKIYILYEMNCFTDAAKIDDSLLDRIYREFLDNKNFNSIYDFVLAIQEQCAILEVDFLEVEDYKEMFRNL